MRSERKRRLIWIIGLGIVALAAVGVWTWPRSAKVEQSVEAAKTSDDTDVIGSTKPEMPGEEAKTLSDEVIDEATLAAVDKLIKSRMPNPYAVRRKIDLKAEKEKRKNVALELPVYSEIRDALKAEILAAEGEITKEATPGLVARAEELKETFWEMGDFDDISSFDHIYEARAVLELCLEADPKDEGALRQLVEVLQSGWPYLLTPKEIMRLDGKSDTADEKKLYERNFEGFYGSYEPLWTLWETHVSRRADPTLDDLAVACALIRSGMPSEAYERVTEEVLKKNPDATKEEIIEARMGFSKGRQMRVLEWALDASQRKGAQWDVYGKILRRGQEKIQSAEYLSSFAVPVRIPLRADSVKYWGRDHIFEGPRERRESLVPLHEAWEEWEKIGIKMK